MTILIHGEYSKLADLDDDKRHSVSGSDKFRIYFIFHQSNDDNDVVNDFEGIMNSEKKKIALLNFAFRQIHFSGS